LRNSVTTVSSSAVFTSFNNSVNINGLLSLGNRMNVVRTVSTASLTVSSNATLHDVNIGGATTLVGLNATSIATSLLDVSGLFQANQSSDKLNLSRPYAGTMSFSMTNDGMVFYINSSNIAQALVSFTEVPTTPQRSYIFTFILKPSSASSPYYLKPHQLY
jgi:hypothetical protein